MVRKRVLISGVVALAVVLVMSGCGIPQEDYDAVEAERDSAKAQVTSLQSDLNRAESNLDTAEADLAAMQADYDTVQDDLDAAESRVSSLQSEASSVKSQLSTAKSDLATAQARIAELEAELAPPEEEEPPAEEEEEPPAEEEEEPPAEEEEEPPAEEDGLATYTNEEYGFSIKYPEDWIADVAEGTTIWAHKHAVGVPSSSISVTPTDHENYQANYTEIVAPLLEGLGAYDVVITSETAGQLTDGTATIELVIDWGYYGYELTSFAIAVKMADDSWLAFWVNGCDALGGPYDEAAFKAIVYF